MCRVTLSCWSWNHEILVVSLERERSDNYHTLRVYIHASYNRQQTKIRVQKEETSSKEARRRERACARIDILRLCTPWYGNRFVGVVGMNFNPAHIYEPSTGT